MDEQVETNTRVIHVFDREGDIAEVFAPYRQLKHTGVLVRAKHNRSLDHNSERLWDTMESKPIRFEQEIDVPATANRKGRRTKLAVRFSRVNLRTPYRFDNREPFIVYAVAYLGGYLEHRRKTPIGIQVLWRGWLKLHDLCEGWQLARNT